MGRTLRRDVDRDPNPARNAGAICTTAGRDGSELEGGRRREREEGRGK